MSKDQKEKRNTKIVAALVKGKATKIIAAQFHLSVERIRKLAALAGLRPENKEIMLRNKKLFADFDKGVKKNQLARKYKLSSSYVDVILSSKKGFQSETKKEIIKRNEKIVDFFLKGYACKNIASQVQLNDLYVKDILRKQGLFFKVFEHRKTGRDVKIISAVKSGKTFKEVAAQFSLTNKRIQQIASDAGISKLKEREIRNRKIKQEFKKGSTNIQLAEKFNLCKAQINLITGKH